MDRYAAFLRGMNLGGRRITNEELREHFEDLGFSSVGTFLASGNVAFETDPTDPRELEEAIERGLGKGLGYEVATFVRTGKQVRTIAGHRAFDSGVIASSGGKLQVALLDAIPSAGARESVLGLATDRDRLAFGEWELYWLPEGGVSGTELDWKRIEGILGTTTVRTRRTIERLVAKYF